MADNAADFPLFVLQYKYDTVSPNQSFGRTKACDRGNCKSRAKTREILADSKRGHCGTYHLVINTTDWKIKDLTPAVAEFVARWFGR